MKTLEQIKADNILFIKSNNRLLEQNTAYERLNAKQKKEIGRQNKKIGELYKIIKELTIENDDLVIDAAKLQNDHDRHVAKILDKGMEGFMKEAHEYLNEEECKQKGIKLLLKHGGNKEEPKVAEGNRIRFNIIGFSTSDLGELKFFLRLSIANAWFSDEVIKVKCESRHEKAIKEEAVRLNPDCQFDSVAY